MHTSQSLCSFIAALLVLIGGVMAASTPSSSSEEELAAGNQEVVDIHSGRRTSSLRQSSDADYAILVKAAVERLQFEQMALYTKFSWVLVSQSFLFSGAALMAPRTLQELHQFKALPALLPIIGIVVSLYVTISCLPNMRAITFIANEFCDVYNPKTRKKPEFMPFVYAVPTLNNDKTMVISDDGESRVIQKKKSNQPNACTRWFAGRVLNVDVALLTDPRIGPMLTLSILFIVSWVILLMK